MEFLISEKANKQLLDLPQFAQEAIRETFTRLRTEGVGNNLDIVFLGIKNEY